MQTTATATAPALVTNFDNYGSQWGTSPIEETLAAIAEHRATGATVDEWDVTDPSGRPMRVVRLADPTFLDTICVIPA